ncbi:MAG: hypothetical protein H6726_21885 [Sandaracinaceae bacterium]|nr:hypothetical protein [Myxococcales bacterium]MCB9660309.1 hypothetical protein [Sandaracinaceae bacterium]
MTLDAHRFVPQRTAWTPRPAFTGHQRQNARPLGVAASALLSAWLMGCDGGDGPPYVPPDPQTCAVDRYEPGTLHAFPTRDQLVEDPLSATGVRFALSLEAYPEAANFRAFRSVASSDLEDVDGASVNASMHTEWSLPFAGVQTYGGAPNPSAPVGIVVLPVDDGEPVLWPVDVEQPADGLLRALPLTPLPERRWVAHFVRMDAAPCMGRSASMHARLRRPDTHDAAAIAALMQLGVVDSASELAALHTLPTQTVRDDAEAIAADIRGLSVSELTPDTPTCTTEGALRHCVASASLWDYRDADGVVRPPHVGTARWDVPVHTWLPADHTPGERLPTVMFGHGIGGGAVAHGERLAAFAPEHRFVLVATSALGHEDHPTSTGGDEIAAVLSFLGFEDGAVSARRVRDNFRQSNFDRLQVMRWLASGPDVDGDGEPDVDATQLTYIGVSLGGIMGPQLLAQSDAFQTALLVVPGGRLSDVVTNGESIIQSALGIFLPGQGRDPRLGLLVAELFQTAMDRGDGASWAPYVLGERLRGDVPNLLLGMVVRDNVVPNSSQFALIRALDIPVVGDLLRADPAISSVSDMSGALVAGAVQVEWMQGGSGAVPATHADIADNPTGADTWFGFLDDAWDGPPVTIVEPERLTPP